MDVDPRLENIRMCMGVELRKAREYADLTIDALSERVQKDLGLTLHPGALSKIERGQRAATLNTIIGYSYVSGVRPDHFFKDLHVYIYMEL